MNNSNGSGLFAGIASGLTSTYSILANASNGGVTLQSIANARSNPSLASSLNPTFASYIQSNFSTLDADRDGKLGATELSNITNKMMSTGLTAAQLSQLGPAAGISGATLEQVLEHFRDIDTNCDGKITSAEVSAFKISSAMDKKKTEFANRAATNQSVFYGDESASTNDSSSILDFKRLNGGSIGNTSGNNNS